MDNVIYLQSRKNKQNDEKKPSQLPEVPQSETEESFFLDLMKRNHRAKERLREARIKANQSVLRSYKIKK